MVQGFKLPELRISLSDLSEYRNNLTPQCLVPPSLDHEPLNCRSVVREYACNNMAQYVVCMCEWELHIGRAVDSDSAARAQSPSPYAQPTKTLYTSKSTGVFVLL